MSRAEWEEAYRDGVAHLLQRRAHRDACCAALPPPRGRASSKTLFVLNWFIGSIRIEKIHPLEAGFVRLKFRRDRRPGLPLEPALTFYPRFLAELVSKQVRWVWLWVRLRRLYREIRYGKDRLLYRDEALTPVTDEADTLGMFDTDEAKAFVARERRLAEVRAGAA